ncbi:MULTISPECIES: SDR family NAD(P)-dependent oxidoreductase [Pseudonocardia]|uniref:3-oxoacyl-[acyl-carrier-protein] reductase FabG1 n=2 Tax=Pseudonocardia TaxID=1847 RepID=A0A1Y2MJC1_PSEAH|nr:MULTISPECIES: SDR family NAD(P)-dependent oxidoreductase [Pseudonocardia]OSY35350.1 3-oxoacyl-[acyl-carrier-protein] reductase FabG1 [Pseudonocardia autotrophica]TDN75484.1 short-subunit dehydrogenase [Pseudonocardia autotrophica]BBF99450.1 3-ketoacyl-ACP reductase [Pseudonocardia autotrophica]GEC28536.1 3-ketoacyl-ACP reductase [Pseudonocardia saturnea]
MSHTVVVTGAAGALGRAVVEEFRARGHRVVALGRPGPGLDRIAADGVHPIGVDLTDRGAVGEAFDRIDDLPGTVGTLVAVAGGYAPGGLADADPDTLHGLFDTNYASVVWAAQAAAPRIAGAGGGAIVTVGAKAGATGPAQLVHGTSKAAVHRLTELLADELRPQRIRVNAVLPSVIDTPTNREWMSDDAVARAVTPAAIARVVAFLAGPDAAPISGALIPVHGDS